jgi:hypothetical protein
MLILAILIIGVPLLCLALADDGARYLLVQLGKIVVGFGGVALGLYVLFIVLIIARH